MPMTADVSNDSNAYSATRKAPSDAAQLASSLVLGGYKATGLISPSVSSSLAQFAAQLAASIADGEPSQPGLGEGDSFDYGRPSTDLWGPDGTGVPDLDDIDQGALANCWAMGGLAASVLASPEAIRDNIVDNGDGTYTVTFYQKNSEGGFDPVEVTVDDQVPVDASGNPVYAQETNDGENWVMIYEKAYAEFNGGSYDNLQWNSVEKSLEEMNGTEFQILNPDTMSDAELVAALSEGPATMSTQANGTGKDEIATFDDQNVAGQHVYVVENIYEQDGEIYVEFYNPWGHTHPTLTLDQIREVSNRIGVADD